MQACSCCLTALGCIRPACPLAWKALGRPQITCCMLPANGVNEARRQQCWCRFTFETMLATAVTRACGPSAPIQTLAALSTVCTRRCKVSLVCTPRTYLPAPVKMYYFSMLVVLYTAHPYADQVIPKANYKFVSASGVGGRPGTKRRQIETLLLHTR